MGIKRFNVMVLFRLAGHADDEVGNCAEEEESGETGSLDCEEGGDQTTDSEWSFFLCKDGILE